MREDQNLKPGNAAALGDTQYSRDMSTREGLTMPDLGATLLPLVAAVTVNTVALSPTPVPSQHCRSDRLDMYLTGRALLRGSG